MEVIDAVGLTEGTLDHLNYGDDERRIWVIQAEEDSRIVMDFSSFDLETDFDFLWIYDGDNVFARKLGRWNTQSPGTVSSTGNAICLEFRSDCATTATGWQATWRVRHFGMGVEENDAETPGYDDVTVFDVTGRLLLNRRVTCWDELSLEWFPQGVYLLRCVRSSDGKVEVKRFIR